MRFRIQGNEYDIDRDGLVEAVRGVRPNAGDGRHKFYVEIGGTLYPIKQPVHLVTGLPYIAFTAQYAYRILTGLGFKVRGAEESPPRRTRVDGAASPRKFAILLQTDEEGYVVASCPSLPGCHSQGRTKEEAVANISEAIRGYLASLREHGEPVPQGEVEQVEVAG